MKYQKKLIQIAAYSLDLRHVSVEEFQFFFRDTVPLNATLVATLQLLKLTGKWGCKVFQKYSGHSCPGRWWVTSVVDRDDVAHGYVHHDDVDHNDVHDPGNEEKDDHDIVYFDGAEHDEVDHNDDDHGNVDPNADNDDMLLLIICMYSNDVDQGIVKDDSK